MRLLFVDDEPRILSGIENALIFAPDEWDADFADSGEEALEMMAAKAYDVLVTDMKMPGLTGADVLEHAKANHPDVVRLVLSGEVDPKLAERAMPLLHEFVSKPCDPDDLFEIIDRVAESSRQLEAGTVRDVLGSLDSLPSQPDLHVRIRDSIDRNEGHDAIAKVIENDLAIASSVIKTANSAFYGFRTPTETVREAVSRLGSETVSGIVLNAEIGSWVGAELRSGVEALNAHSAQVADLVRELVGREHAQAALAGLLHDIGVLVLLSQFPDEYRELVESNDGLAKATEQREREAFGASHAEIGAYMLQMWNADDIVVEATRHHHDPDELDGCARRIVEAIIASDAALAAHEVSQDIDRDLVVRARRLAGETEDGR